MSTQEESTISESSAGQGRKKRAALTWQHSRPPRPDEAEREGKSLIFYCKYCSEYRCRSTTAARHHLRSTHQINIIEGRPILLLRDQGVQEITSTSTISSHTINKRTLNEALVRLIIRRDLPFRAVEWPELHTLLQIANPNINQEVISSHSTVSGILGSLWLSAKDNLRKRLQSSLSKVHFAGDIWTSPNRLLFLGICVHFVDQDTRQLSRALLSLRPILTHRGDEQAAEILPLFEDFGILPKIGYFIGDNHPSNDVLCRVLSSSLGKRGIKWNAIQHRLRCNGHILNLAIQAFLFDKKDEIEQREADINLEEEKSRQSRWRQKGPLGKLHNIAVHIRGSPARSKEFKSLAGRGLPLDNETRWNSWYLMLRVALDISSSIDAYSKAWRDDLKNDYLSPEDWESLKDISDFLQPFYRVTLETQGDFGTIDRVLWTMDILVKHFDQSLKAYSKSPLQLSILRSWQVFDKYFAKTEDSSVYAAALVLHPSRRLHYIKKNWRKEWHKPAIEGIRELWELYRDINVLEPTPFKVEKKAEVLDTFDAIARDYEVVDSSDDEDEYDIYTREKAIPIQGSALNWWLAEERRNTWPRLSQMAIDILSIPAMSDEPERVFSGARRTISWERTQMGPENIERTQCLKSWMNLGLVSRVANGDEEVVDFDSDD